MKDKEAQKTEIQFYQKNRLKLVLNKIMTTCEWFIWYNFVAPLTISHSVKCTMSWSDFEIPQFFIVEFIKQCIEFNIGCVTNVTF